MVISLYYLRSSVQCEKMESYCFMVFAIFVIFSAAFPCNIGGNTDALAASRQYLPVAVQLDVPSFQRPRFLQPKEDKNQKRSSSGKDESENLLESNSENNDAEKESLDVSPPQNNANATFQTTKNIGNDRLLEVTTLSLTEEPPIKDSKKIQSKRPRRRRPKDSKKLIFHQNVNWNLRTINDKPAELVIAQDEASQPRFLSDTSESTLVNVKKLKQ